MFPEPEPFKNQDKIKEKQEKLPNEKPEEKGLHFLAFPPIKTPNARAKKVSGRVLSGSSFSFLVCAYFCVLASPFALGQLQQPVDRPQWRPTPHLLWIRPSRVTRLLLGVEHGMAWFTTGGGVVAIVTLPRLGSTIAMVIVRPDTRLPPPQQTLAISSVPGFVGGFLFLFATQL